MAGSVLVPPCHIKNRRFGKRGSSGGGLKAAEMQRGFSDPFELEKPTMRQIRRV